MIVSLCMNDERGLPRGRVCMVEFGDGEVEMDSGLAMENSNPACSIDDAAHRLRVGHCTYPIQGSRSHVGNIAWNAVSMARNDARRLVLYLLKRGFTITGAWVETDLAPPKSTGA